MAYFSDTFVYLISVNMVNMEFCLWQEEKKKQEWKEKKREVEEAEEEEQEEK